MKTLVMTKHVDRKGYSVYRVLDDQGNTIACRSSNSQHYIACYIVPNSKAAPVDRKILPYKICHAFSRKDLIGKGDSAKVKPYAVAYLQELDNII